LTSEVSGTLPVVNGGTGAATFTNNGILVGSGSLPVSTVTGSQYQVLTSGAGGAPSFGSLSLDQSAAVTGILPKANGGTGVSSTATFPGSGVIVTEEAPETLTNKTLTGATINGASSIGGSTTIDTAGTIKSGAATVAGNVTIVGNDTTANKLVLNDKGSANSVALKAPDTLASSLTLELPSSNGSSGQVLSTNGSGILSWVSAAVGSVTNVTGTAPISVANGTSTPVISMSQANGTTNGYLSSGDWTTFNSKQAAGNYVTGLTGDVSAAGPGSSTATLAAVAIAGTSTKVSYDVKGRVTSGTSLEAADLPSHSAALITSGTLATTNGGTGVNSTATFPTSGVVVTEAATETLTNKTLSDAAINGASTISGSTTIDTTGTVKSGAQTAAGNITILGNSTTANKLILNDKGSTNSVALKASDNLTSSLTWELPGTNGSSGQVLSTNGSGTLSWVSAAVGSVTNVTGTAPISVATGTSTPVISMSQANGSTNGYLSSADWATFNSKQAAGNYITALTGDVTASGSGSAAATLSATGVSSGTYTKVTVDAKGRATSGTSLVAADIPPLPTSIIGSGTLGVANGGTGAATITNNGVVIGAGTGALSGVTGTSGQVMTVNGSNQPIFGAINLASSAAVSSTLTVANGGTGAATLAANNVLLGNGTSALQAVAPGTSGNVLTSNGSTWTSAASVTNWAVPGTIGSTTPNTGAFSTLTTTGTVGIGTTSPQSALDVSGSIVLSDGNAFATNKYYSGGWKYKANGWGGHMQYFSTGGFGLFVNAQNSSGAGVAVTDIQALSVSANGNIGIGTTAPAAALQVTGQIVATLPSTLTPTGTTQTIDFATGNIQTLNLSSATGTVTLTFTNVVAGGSYALKIIQGATARTLTWPTGTKWPGGTPITLSTNSGAIDLVTLFYDGTSYYAVGGNNFL
jgi:hypothetical protein